jgi:thymidylate synthase
MADLILTSNANDAWLQALRLLRSSPMAQETDSRCGPTTELLHVTISIEDPRQRWIFARNPVISPAFALAEVIWIMAGRNDAGVLNFFNRDLPAFAGNGSTYHGAYGHRLRHHHGMDQLSAAYEALRANPSSRQAVLQIWDAATDLPDSQGQPRSPDIPCNTQAVLRIQGRKLHWLQIMRSNDLFRGLPYNLVQFTTLQETLAGWLGVGLGSYTHVVSCLHFYHTDLNNLKRAKTADQMPNPESLCLLKPDSDHCFRFLSDLITGASTNLRSALEFIEEIRLGTIPPPYTNIAMTIIAEALRRHGDKDAASRLLLQISNPCLFELSKRWFARKAVVQG